MSTTPDFGKRLRELRERAGMSQAELSRRAEVHAVNISKLESGKYQPTWPVVIRLAAALEVTTLAFSAQHTAT